jgi:hypothetical protein
MEYSVSWLLVTLITPTMYTTLLYIPGNNHFTKISEWYTMRNFENKVKAEYAVTY